MKKAFNHKCYKTKDDKRHETIVSRPIDVSRERWQEIFGTEEDRLKSLEEFRRRKRERKATRDCDFATISKWDPEWTYLSTGKRMSKRQLKEYCRRNGKIWENS